MAKRAAARAKKAALKNRPDAAMPADHRLDLQKQYLFDAPSARLAQHRARPPPPPEDKVRRAVVEAAWKVHADATRDRRAERLRYQGERSRVALDELRAEDPDLFADATQSLDREVFEDPVLAGDDPIRIEVGPLLPHWRKVPVTTPGRGGWQCEPVIKLAASRLR